eukprot:359188-Chlamydomonas_euryale.AAC.5
MHAIDSLRLHAHRPPYVTYQTAHAHGRATSRNFHTQGQRTGIFVKMTAPQSSTLRATSVHDRRMTGESQGDKRPRSGVR